MQDGTNRFLATFGPADYHSAADYLKVVGTSLFTSSIGTKDVFGTWAASVWFNARSTAILTPSGPITLPAAPCSPRISRRSIV
jgi:hypothetical protein